MKRFFGSKDDERKASLAKVEPEFSTGDPASGQPIKMTGTTTFGAENLTAIFAAHHLSDGGLIETSGWLIAEPDNPADANAIAVHVEGTRIGYLPGHLAAHIPLTPDEPYPCQVQLWGEPSKGKLRVIGWVAAGLSTVAWPHSPENPPPITTQAQRAAHAASITEMVDDALSGSDQTRAQQFAAGMVQGYHYLELAEPIKELKRQGRLEEALVLCYAAIEGAEKAREGREPAPAYTIQAAIIHRKLGQRDQEIAVLERWLRLCPREYREGSEVHKRLVKLRGQIDTAQINTG